MLAVAKGEACKNFIYPEGRYGSDARIQMVKAAAAHNGQRTTAFMATNINFAAV